MQIFKNTHIDFLKFGTMAFLLSGLVIFSGAISFIVNKGLNMGIDFTGGTVVQVAFEQSQSIDDIRAVLARGELAGIGLQSFPKNNSVLIRIKESGQDPETIGDTIQRIMKEHIPDNPFTVERVEFVGPVVGRHLLKQALLAILLSAIGIIVYIGFRFKSGIWGVAAVIALVHDVLFVLCLFSFSHKEITLTVIAALLTLAGYSVNDTIVIFDRIRENIRLMRKESFRSIMNISMNETLSRTVMTSVTTLLTVLALYLFGGAVIHDFAFALFYGIIVGTYSTLFIATPLVYLWQTKSEKGMGQKK